MEIRQVLTDSFAGKANADELLTNALQYLDQDCNVLVVGAGGLGCEILKCLALTGFRRITVVDMDTIDVSNLNRQFLFSESDVGSNKAEVAARCISERCGHLGVVVNSRVCRIQDLPESFYAEYSMVIAGLDNIEARRWLNSMLFSLVVRSDAGEVDRSSLRFFLDGGTEGLKGQARVIIPTITACFECTIGTFPPETTYPLCTLAEKPRLPEHCVEYVYTVMWDEKLTSFNADDPTHIDWVYMRALARAEAFGITGVTLSLTKGVVKRIVPAVASTNALIAAVLVNEAFKIATYAHTVMDNYFMYMGSIGINASTFAYEKNPDCPLCNDTVILLISENATLQQLIDVLTETFSTKSPSVSHNRQIIFMQSPPDLRMKFVKNLQKKLTDLLLSDPVISVTDPAIFQPLHVQLVYTKRAPE